MESLALEHQSLVERHRRELASAAEALMACPDWDLSVPVLLLTAPQASPPRCLPVGRLAEVIEHLPAELDAFVGLRQQGVPLEEARERCARDQGLAFRLAWERTQDRVPLLSHDDLSRFAELSRRGFQRLPRQLLVVVQWPEQVTAFLVACERQAAPGTGFADTAAGGGPGGQPASRDGSAVNSLQVRQHGATPGDSFS